MLNLGFSEEQIVRRAQEDFNALWDAKLGKRFNGLIARTVKQKLEAEIVEDIHEIAAQHGH